MVTPNYPAAPQTTAPQTFEEWMSEGAKKAEAARSNHCFNDAALEQILNAVGKRCWPPTLNREALRAALERVSRIYPTWDLLVDRRPPPGKTRKRVEDIANTVKKLTRLLPAVTTPDDEDLDPLMRLMLRAADDEGARRAIEGVQLIGTICGTILQNKLYGLDLTCATSQELADRQGSSRRIRAAICSAVSHVAR